MIQRRTSTPGTAVLKTSRSSGTAASSCLCCLTIRQTRSDGTVVQLLELPRVLRQRRQGIRRQNDDVANHSSGGYSKLFCVGISHRTANVEIRERYLSRRPEESLRTNCGCAEAVMLATCNRVELYAAARDIVTAEQVAHCLVRRE